MPRIIETESKNLIGDKLRELRQTRNMSQQEVSDRLETYAVYVCRGSVSRIEDGSRTVTDIELSGLAKVFNISIAEFFQ